MCVVNLYYYLSRHETSAWGSGDDDVARLIIINRLHTEPWPNGYVGVNVKHLGSVWLDLL